MPPKTNTIKLGAEKTHREKQKFKHHSASQSSHKPPITSDLVGLLTVRVVGNNDRTMREFCAVGAMQVVKLLGGIKTNLLAQDHNALQGISLAFLSLFEFERRSESITTPTAAL
jgi:hypothetical protein